MNYTSKAKFAHDQPPSTGVLLVNLGTPDAATPKAVRRYLAEFLADPRVVEFPRLLWRIVLHGVILRVRPGHVAKAYGKVWTEHGSPLLVESKAICAKLQSQVDQNLPGPVHIELAMRYGNPSIKYALEQLRDKNIERLIILPLYPQYSATTTAAVYDEISQQLKHWRWLPNFRMLMQYHDHPLYIRAIADQITDAEKQYGKPDKLILSFHGIPERYLTNGDPYFCHCHKTARLVSEYLKLEDDDWVLAFQSRFGREPWLQPYLDKMLEKMPQAGTQSIHIIAPGFSVDCLETLEELAMQNAELFKQNGGESYRYIPALNDSEAQIDLLLGLIKQEGHAWPEIDDQSSEANVAVRVNNAKEKGATRN